MALERDLFNRAELLLGTDKMQQIHDTKVLVMGVGGVGSWCAESLVRSGVGHITIVDSDCVCLSNINRQIMATTKTVGQAKVDVLKARFLEINPNAEVVALQKVYSEETAYEFNLSKYDYVIDAIDNLKDKALLILNATQADCKFFSSMGAALKMDPTKVQVAEFWKVKGDPLAKALRNRFKRNGIFPRKKFKCVFSEEVMKNDGTDTSNETTHPMCPEAQNSTGNHNLMNQGFAQKRINGSLSHVTAIFGFTLAGLVMQDIVSRG